MGAQRTIYGLRREVFRDPTWTSLPAASQALYLVIAEDNFGTKAGIVPVMVRRWSNRFGDQTEESITSYLDALVKGGRAIVDYDNGIDPWLLLPKLLVDNGSSNQPNVIAGAIRAATDCRSAILRAEFARVIADLPARETGLAVGLISRKSHRKPIPAALRLAVYMRDDWTCQDCGRRILPTADEERSGERAPYDDVGWLELDHIHPHSDGGEDTTENLRALCSRCNRVKGVRALLSLPERGESR